MIWVVLLIGICVLGLWTVMAWLTHQGWKLVAGLPWEQAFPKIQELPVPPWLFPDWKVWIQDLAPLLKWAFAVVQDALGWLGDGVPILIWTIWGVGAILILLVFGALTFMAIWLKKSRERMTPSGVSI